MLIGGFDVLYIGVKGFSTLARARKALIRPKGAPKDADWTVISFTEKKKKTKAQKEDFLTKTILKLTKQKDVEAEKVIREEKKKVAKVPEAAEKIKFIPLEVSDKVIKSHTGQRLEIRKYYFQSDKSYEFVKSRDIKLFDVNRYLKAVQREFTDEVYSKHGKASYLIRLYHDYANLPSAPEIDPMQKGFSGMGLNRQTMGKEDVKEQFEILNELYADNFSRYLMFARSDTYFRFTGFTAEVTLDVLEQEEDIPEYMIPLKKKKRKKKKAAKKVAKKAAKKLPKKPAKKAGRARRR